jgi:hypothetical protein
VYDCVVRSLRSHARIDPVTKPAEGAKDQKPEQKQKQKQKPDQKPLTLALSQRERGLNRVVHAKYGDLRYRVECKYAEIKSPSP